MGSLQTALAIAGVLILAGLGAHGAWQARRWSGGRKPVAASAPIEPSFEVPQPEAVSEAGRVPLDVAVTPPRRALSQSQALDPLIDAVAAMRLEAPVSGEVAAAHLPTTRRVGSKPMTIEGLDARTGTWQPVQAGLTYIELQAGVQLANRSGALNEIEYSEWVQKIQAFADAVGATPEFPDMLDVVARARELDTFASEHDAQLALRLHARTTAWSVGFIAQQAARAGFASGALPGRLVVPGDDEGAPPRLSLQYDPQAALADDPAQAAVREVTLAFDVPQTQEQLLPFRSWCEAGAALAQALNALVTDDQGQELDRHGLEIVGQELRGLYEKLAARGLTAGSPVARRLFS